MSDKEALNEWIKRNDERNMRAAERAHDRSKDVQFKHIDAAMRDATEAMKVALAINGGGAVAVLRS